jgi:hypothetical protein
LFVGRSSADVRVLALHVFSKRFKFFVCHALLEAVNTVPVMPRYFVRTSSEEEEKSQRDWELVNKWNLLFDARFQGRKT